MEAYSIGQQFKFEASKASLITTQLGSMSFHIEILQQLSVGKDRSSQVLRVRIVNHCMTPLNPSIFVAKCYDPMFCRSDIRPEWPSEQAYCSSRKRIESKAYRRLHTLQQSVLPTFYGEYQYETSIPSKFGVMDAILVEYIDHPTLERLTPHDVSPDALESITRYSLQQCHDIGVYHRDISPSNIFFTDNQAIICDWENATFQDDDTMEDPKNWGESDMSALISMLKKFGLEDKRPDPPRWFFNWGDELVGTESAT
jgi:serine/threonine protein kinase